MQSDYKKELQELKAKSLYRKLRVLEDHQGTRAVFEGRKILLFCGNDYLGMSRHPRVIAAAHKAIESSTFRRQFRSRSCQCRRSC